MSSTPRAGGASGLLGLPLFLLASLGVAAYTLRVPRDPVGFDLERARTDLAVLAREPRPSGSEPLERAREWLLAALAPSGAEILLQENGDLVNVIARIEGSAPTGTLLFVAHYDSRPETPGATDDGAAVVTLVQLALHAAGADPRNDIVVLFTDGEEEGLLGARVYVEDAQPLDDDLVVLNFDAIGGGGRLVMFQVGPESGGLVAAYAGSVAQPVTTSIAPFVYSLLPRDTDFTPFQEAGARGLNFALVGGGTVYHDEIDTPDALSTRSLAHLGDTVFALYAGLAGADVGALARDERMWFDVLGSRVLDFGLGATRTLALIAALAAVLGARRLLREQPGSSAVAGAKRFAWFTVSSSAVLACLWLATRGLALGLAESTGTVRGENFTSTWLLLGGVWFSGLALHTRRLAASTPAERAGLVAAGFGAWGLLPLLALVASPASAGQAPLAILFAAVGLLIGSRPAVAIGGALAALLLAPVLVLTVHLMSKSAVEGAVAASLGFLALTGLCGPWLAKSPNDARTVRFLVGLGLVLFALGGAAELLGH